MRLLFASTAGDGHLASVLPVAEACRDVGHAVAVAVPARAEAKIHARGLETRRLPDLDPERRAELDRAIRTADPVEGNRIMVREIFGRLNAECALPELSKILQSFAPDVVLREPFEPASWIAATAADVPTVLLPCATWRSLSSMVGDLVAGAASEAEGAGVQIEASAHQGASAIWSGVPASLEAPDAPPADVVRARLTHRPEGARRPSRTPSIFACFGTVTGHLPGLLERVGGALFEAVAPLPLRCVIAIGRGVDPARLGTPPENVQVERFVPMAQALTTARLLVSHGGFGTTLGGLAAGVPILGLPLFSLDQVDNCALIEAGGYGQQLPLDGDQSAEAIRAALLELLEDEATGARAHAIAAEMQGHLSLDRLARELPGVQA